MNHSLSQQVELLLNKGKSFPIGHVSTRKDGKWKKVADTGNNTKDWEKVVNIKSTKPIKEKVTTKKKISDQKGGKRLKDIGEHIGGSKKEIATATKAYNIKKLKQIYAKHGYEEMAGYVTKAKLLKKIDYDYLKEKNINGAIGLFFKELSMKIPTKPVENSYQKRNIKNYDYIKGYLDSIEIVNRIFDQEKISKFKTLDEAKEFIYKSISSDDKDILLMYMFKFGSTLGHIAESRPYRLGFMDEINRLNIRYNQEKSGTGKKYSKKERFDASWSWYKSKKGIERKETTRFVRATTANIERTGPKISRVSPKALLTKLGLRGVEYGNYLTVQEQKHHAQVSYEAFSDLSDILGIKPKSIGQGKISSKPLAMAFGARGSGNYSAHYEPLKKVINITRNEGGGSLAHEYGHFIDNILGKYINDSNIAELSSLKRMSPKVPKELLDAYANLIRTMNSKTIEKKNITVIPKADQKAQIMNQMVGFVKASIGSQIYDKLTGNELNNHRGMKAVDEIMYIMDLTKIGLSKKLPSDKVLEKNIDILINKYSPMLSIDYGGYTDKEYRKQAKDFIKIVYGVNNNKTITGENAKLHLIKRAVKLIDGLKTQLDNATDVTEENGTRTIKVKSNFVQQLESMSKYWSRPNEKFARCFETWVSDELDKKKQKNTYLVYGAKLENYKQYKQNDKGIYEKFPYPVGEERKAINNAMSKFIKAAIKTNSIQKALQWGYDPQSTEKSLTSKINNIFKGHNV